MGSPFSIYPATYGRNEYLLIFNGYTYLYGSGYRQVAAFYLDPIMKDVRL